jgi:acyl-coenzyme A synthetase/AMP-(fatty) acid ligase
VTVRSVLAEAEAIGDACDALAEDRRVLCVGSHDRVDVAAALLAAFAGRVSVLLPHALSAEALADVAAVRPFGAWLGPAEWQVPGNRLDGATLREHAAKGDWHIADPDAARVWLYTGGSTGRPRLWSKSARNLMGESAMQVRVHGITPQDSILATVPPNHIYGVLFSVLAPILSGAPVERTTPFFPQEVQDAIERLHTTVLVSAPVHLRALASSEWKGDRVRLVTSSGAPLAAADAQAFHARSALWPLEVYGSTETGGVATRSQGDATPGWSLIEGVERKISDDQLEVRSPYISSEVPWDADGWFVMGDTARAVGDRFELLGRTDGVVKIGGRRVDLRQVEEALRAIEGVTDAVALSRVAASGRGNELIAVVETARASADVLREVREKLPSAAWPRMALCVQRIPVTAAGKRDRAAIEALITEALR